jgi:hypothetical protein
MAEQAAPDIFDSRGKSTELFIILSLPIFLVGNG